MDFKLLLKGFKILCHFLDVLIKFENQSMSYVNDASMRNELGAVKFIVNYRTVDFTDTQHMCKTMQNMLNNKIRNTYYGVWLPTLWISGTGFGNQFFCLIIQKFSKIWKLIWFGSLYITWMDNFCSLTPQSYINSLFAPRPKFVLFSSSRSLSLGTINLRHRYKMG